MAVVAPSDVCKKCLKSLFLKTDAVTKNDECVKDIFDLEGDLEDNTVSISIIVSAVPKTTATMEDEEIEE